MPRIGIVPDTKPKMTDAELMNLLNSKGIEVNLTEHPLWIIGVRGYYLSTMGDPTKEDRGIYDDAIFIYSEPVFRSFNANTNPANYSDKNFRKEGKGYEKGKKGIATLQTGLWLVHKFADHVPQSGAEPYLALCQRGRSVSVIRDGFDGKDYPDEGEFGINIHRGGYNKVSSLGCQTIYPDQWGGADGFVTVAKNLAIDFFGDTWKKVYIPYALIES